MQRMGCCNCSRRSPRPLAEGTCPMTDTILKNLRAAQAFISEERENRWCADDIYGQAAEKAERDLTAAIAGVEKMAAKFRQLSIVANTYEAQRDAARRDALEEAAKS